MALILQSVDCFSTDIFEVIRDTSNLIVTRVQFLRCREAWLADIIDDLDPSNPYDYVKRLTDHHRVHLFDVVMQYRAIFADDTSNQVRLN